MRRFSVTLKTESGTVCQEIWAHTIAEACQIVCKGYGDGIQRLDIGELPRATQHLWVVLKRGEYVIQHKPPAHEATPDALILGPLNGYGTTIKAMAKYLLSLDMDKIDSTEVLDRISEMSFLIEQIGE